jgi:hypothetical protein
LAPSTTNLATASRRIGSKKITTERKKWYLFGGVCDSIGRMDTDSAGFPSDIETLKAALIVERAKALEAAAELAIARARASQCQSARKRGSDSMLMHFGLTVGSTPKGNRCHGQRYLSGTLWVDH